MPYFAEPELKQLSLPSNGDYWVKVLPALRYGDSKKFLDVNDDGSVNLAAKADLYLETVIKEWNLDDESGVLPITKENMDKLQQADALFIINELGGAVDDGAKKN